MVQTIGNEDDINRVCKRQNSLCAFNLLLGAEIPDLQTSLINFELEYSDANTSYVCYK